MRNNEHIPAKVGGLMFVSTIMTQLGGGSAGREGAALQIGGSIGSFFSHKLGVKLGLHPERQKIGVICGMAAVFSGSCSLYSSQRVLNNKMLLESEPVKK